MIEVERVRAEHLAELERLAEAGLCGCGCGSRIDAGGNGRRRYADGHRQRAHRKLVEAEAKVLGVPARLSLKALEATNTSRERHPDAQSAPRKPRRPRPGVTVYLPTLEHAELARRAVVQAHTGQDLDAEVLEVLEDALERRRRRSSGSA